MDLLIMDDDMMAAEGLSAVIPEDEPGIGRIFPAYRISDAKRILEQEKIGIAFLDIEMSGGNGLDLVEYIQQKKMECVVILLTGHAEFAYAQRAVGLEYLLKPAPDEEILATLRKAVQKGIEKGFWKAGQKTVTDAFSRAVRYIEEHQSSPLSREEVAGYVGMNADHLSRLFKKKTNLSLGAYISCVRVKKAKDLLEHTDIPISEAALLAGYSNFSYFSTSFKAEYHMTPSEFRKKRRDFLEEG